MSPVSQKPSPPTPSWIMLLHPGLSTFPRASIKYPLHARLKPWDFRALTGNWAHS